ncbi:MAG TPA: hypothetical protein VNY10_16360 [Roseiarcus sp.]|jgi:hypothetical protein|nr:hypothetical protein [Roseiarcus sp.]
MRTIGVLAACAGVFLNLTAAYALPKRIIILRHAEKFEKAGLCGVGEKRAQALATQYLGYGAKDSLFANGDQPAAFYANTPHAEETIEPAFSTWPKSPSQVGKAIRFDTTLDLNTWSRKAAKEVLTNYKNEIVVMAWEHSRIANAEFDSKYSTDPLTLYQLLGLFNYKHPPLPLQNWCGSNYDYFWIIDYDPNVEYRGVPPTPVNIVTRLQKLQVLPQNTWGSQPPHGVFKHDGGECDATPKPACTPQQGE